MFAKSVLHLVTVTSGRALQYRAAVDRYTLVASELGHTHMLSSEDWDALKKISDWLGAFRAATTQMSTSKKPMLCHTHKVFRSLQKDVHKMILELPEDENPSTIRLRNGLVAAHTKLSDYYFKFDASPYYHWAACTSTLTPSTTLTKCFISA